MPRASAISLSTPRPDPASSLPRPHPDAPAKVRKLFAELVASVPRGHFKVADAPLVEQYAQAVLLARRAYAEIEAHGPIVNGKRSPWVDVLEKAHRSSVALAGRLRLAPQMRADSRAAARSANKTPPPNIYDRLGWSEEKEQ